MALLNQFEPTAPVTATPEEQEKIRESQLAAYTGPSITAGTVEKPSDVVDAPTFQQGTGYITPEMTVQGQLSQILQAGSPLQTLAEGRAEEEANRRGLLSSSMAVGAGQKALYDSALEVAKPDAATFGAFGKTQQEAEYGATQTGYEGDIAAALTAAKGQTAGQQAILEAQLQSELSGQQQAAQQQLLETELTTKERMLGTELGVKQSMQEFQATQDYQNLVTELASREDISTMEAQARFDQSYMETMAEVNFKNSELQAKVAIEYGKIDAENKGAYMDAMKDVMYGYQTAIAKVQAVPSDQVSAAQKQQYVNDLQTQYVDQIDFLSSVYNAQVQWDAGVDFNQPGSTTSPTGTTGGTTGGTTTQPTGYPEGYTAPKGIYDFPQDQVPTTGKVTYDRGYVYDYDTGSWSGGSGGFSDAATVVMLNTNGETPESLDWTAVNTLGGSGSYSGGTTDRINPNPLGDYQTTGTTDGYQTTTIGSNVPQYWYTNTDPLQQNADWKYLNERGQISNSDYQQGLDDRNYMIQSMEDFYHEVARLEGRA